MTLLAASAVLLAACGSGPSASPDTTSRPSAGSSTSTSAPTSSSDPSQAAVLAAYRAAWAAFEHALVEANPEDPQLAATMVDPQLQSVKANLLADQRQGIVGRGPTTLHPKVSAVSSNSATVVDCAYSATELVYKATGKPVPPVTSPENGLATEELAADYSADGLEIGFNADFLRDGLESVSEDKARLKLISPLRPGLIQGEGEDFLYLIMPIRLAG